MRGQFAIITKSPIKQYLIGGDRAVGSFHNRLLDRPFFPTMRNKLSFDRSHFSHSHLSKNQLAAWSLPIRFLLLEWYKGLY